MYAILYVMPPLAVKDEIQSFYKSWLDPLRVKTEKELIEVTFG